MTIPPICLKFTLGWMVYVNIVLFQPDDDEDGVPEEAPSLAFGFCQELAEPSRTSSAGFEPFTEDDE